MDRDPGSPQMLSMIGAVLVACAGMTAFAFTTFETRSDYQSRRDEGIARLVRIEEKLDRLTEDVATLREKTAKRSP